MSRAHLQILAGFMRPYRWASATLCLLILAGSLLESVSVAAFFPVFYALLSRQGAAMPEGVFGRLVALTGQLPFASPIVSAAALLMGLTVAKVLVTLLRERMSVWASGQVLYDTKQRLMDWCARAPYQLFLDTKQGELAHTILLSPQKLGVLLLRVPQVVAECVKILAIASLLLAIWPEAMVALGVIGLGYTALTHAVGRRISYNTGTARATALAEQSTILNEFLNGIRQIMASRSQATWLQRFERTNRLYRDLQIKDLFWTAVPQQLMEVTLVLLIVGAMGVETDLAMLGVFVVAVARLVPSFTAFGRLRMEMLGTLPEAERIHALLTKPLPRRQDGARVFHTLRHGMAFEHVSFSHAGRGELLNDVNLVLGRGTVTALVGPSGAGKSTLINLLLGLFAPTGGRITVDGFPLQEYQLATWLAKMGIVTQDPFIYHSTVRDNILFGRSGIPDERVERAARIANAHEFISALPQGYDTLVGERGMKLSGGQQQRIAIARAMLTDPDILIFDEATSHLDAAAEQRVQDAIDRIADDRTILMVAHRLSSVKQAQTIITLEHGRIVEHAGCQELMR